MIIVVQLIGFIFLIYDKFKENGEKSIEIAEATSSNKNSVARETLHRLQETEYVTTITESTLVENQTETIWDYFTQNDYIFESDLEPENSSEKHTSVGPWDMYSIKPRCFSMCEPPELFFREGSSILSNLIFRWL